MPLRPAPTCAWRAVAFASAFLPGARARAQDVERPGEVVATARATVVQSRDRARLVFSVEEEGTSAAAAESGYVRRHATVLAALNAAGRRVHAARTTEYRVGSAIRYDPVSRVDSLRYTAASLVTVLADSAGLGRLIDRAVRAGATALTSVHPAASDSGPARRAAVATAVAAACRDAEAVASAAGLQLGQALEVAVRPAAPAGTPVIKDEASFGLWVPPPPAPAARRRPLPAPAFLAHLPPDVVQVTARWRLVARGSGVPGRCGGLPVRGRSRS